MHIIADSGPFRESKRLIYKGFLITVSGVLESVAIIAFDASNAQITAHDPRCGSQNIAPRPEPERRVRASFRVRRPLKWGVNIRILTSWSPQLKSLHSRHHPADS